MARWLVPSLAAVLAASPTAFAQPVDPYTPVPVVVPPPNTWAPATPLPPANHDPQLSDQVAASLVARAQELFEAKIYLDAKQLAVEALVKAPNGPAAARAKAIIKASNAALGVVETPAPNVDVPPVMQPVTDPTIPPAQPADIGRPYKTAAITHGALFGGSLGGMIGALVTPDNQASGAVLFGLPLAAAGAFVAPQVARKVDADNAQVLTLGAGNLWGGVIGGMFAASVEGGNGGRVTGAGVMVGSTIGATLGTLGTIGFAKDHQFSEGDVTLIDTFAGIGTVGGLTVGMLMQPAQREAYAVNSILGAAAGLVTGYVVASMTNTTPRRMSRVAGLSLAGAAVPFLLYAAIYDSHSSYDERLVGGLSSLGLIGGAWLGFYLTRDLDVGLDVNSHKKKEAQDAPPAMLGRSSTGTWALDGVALKPLDPRLAPQAGMAITLVGATF
ncbi:hypothetical protein BH11MYX1_BH11MYX1_56930 [soil metagenome]